MLRTELVNILEEIVPALKMRELEDAAKTIFGLPEGTELAKSGKVFQDLLLEARENYPHYRARPGYDVVLEEFGFDEVYSRDAVLRVIGYLSRFTNTSDFMHSSWYEQFQNVAAWLSATRSAAGVVTKLVNPTEPPSGTTIRIVIVDESEDGVSVDRLRNVLRTIEALANDVRKIAEEEIEPRVVQLDSGSDLLVAVKVGFQTAEYLKTLFHGYYEVVRLSQVGFDEKRFKSMLLGLDVIEKVDGMAEKGTIDEAHAAALKTCIVRRLSNLAGYGAVPFEEKESVKKDPKLLTTASMKLLSDPDEKQEGIDDGDESQPTAE